MTWAAVKVLPVPVAPSSTWQGRPSRKPDTILSMACGWSPAGWNGLAHSNLAGICPSLSLRDGPAHPCQEHLHVFPDFLLLLRAAVRQQEGGVVGAQDRDAAVVVEPAAQLADRLGGVQQVVGGG